jgi:hypothetical protein
MARAGTVGAIASGAIAALLAAHAPCALAGESEAGLELRIDAPPDGAIVGDPLGLALVSGRVELRGAARGLDLVLAIDTSHSTSLSMEPARRGWRRWLAWLLPRREAATQALAVEVARALELLSRLDPCTSRVGVVAFAGDRDPATPDAWVEAELGEIEAAREALRDLERRGPRGATNLVDALELARIELLGELGAVSLARPGVSRAVLLLTDGADVDPLHLDPAEARERLRRAVASLRAAGVQVEAVALATRPRAEALEGLTAAGGRWLPVLEASALLAAPEVAAVEVRHLGSGGVQAAALLPGGAFAALVPLAAGPNRLEVRAHTRSGLEARRDLAIAWSAAAPTSPTPVSLLPARTALLASHLRALRAARAQRRSVEIEGER